MEVLKRDGSTKEPVKLDKITARIKKQTYDLNQDHVDYMEVVKKTISGLHDGITTTELDNLAAETAASLSSIHPDYSFLASRIAITRLYKSLSKPFSKNAKRIYEEGFISSAGPFVKKFEEGLSFLEKSIKFDSTDDVSWYNKACALSILNKTEEALDELTVAIGLDSENIIEMKDEKDLDNIKNTERFKRLANQEI